VRAALGNGVTPAEVGEVLMHTAVYAGVPAANAALRVAQETMAELGVADALPDDGT
jgi:4-carboxymuconolactone decarboxylase